MNADVSGVGLAFLLLFGIVAFALLTRGRTPARAASSAIARQNADAGAKLQAGHLYAVGLEALRGNRFQCAARALSLAAARGHTRAQLHYGVLCEHGIGVHLDLERARELYRQASACGDVDAYFRLQVLDVANARTE